MPQFVSRNGAWIPQATVDAQKEAKRVAEEVEAKKALELDINQDGKVDGKDASLAGKVLASVTRRRGRKKKTD